MGNYFEDEPAEFNFYIFQLQQRKVIKEQNSVEENEAEKLCFNLFIGERNTDSAF